MIQHGSNDIPIIHICIVEQNTEKTNDQVSQGHHQGIQGSQATLARIRYDT